MSDDETTDPDVPYGPNVPYGPAGQPWKNTVPPTVRDNDVVRPPQADPTTVYANDWLHGVDQQKLELPAEGMTAAQIDDALKMVRGYEKEKTDDFLGYQVEARLKHLDYEQLKFFLTEHMNNVGDPFVQGTLTTNTKFVERMVLDYYASLWNIPWPGYFKQETTHAEHPETVVPSSYWGYVLTMGSTEGNLDAVLQGRDYLSGKPLYSSFEAAKYRAAQYYVGGDQDADGGGSAAGAAGEQPETRFQPVAIYSDEAHYSVVKAVHTMAVPTIEQMGKRYDDPCPITDDGHWPKAVPTNPPDSGHPIGDGRIDVDKLMTVAEFFASRGHPILLVLTVGTTFKGATDPVRDIAQRMSDLYETYPIDTTVSNAFTVWSPRRTTYETYHIETTRTPYWLHVDAALGGSYMPFLEMASYEGRFHPKPDVFDFRVDGVHSMVTSGHKIPGAPWPTGVYMTWRQKLIQPPDHPEYIGSPDTTFAGSRNGFSAMILWYYFATHSYADQIYNAIRCQEVGQYAKDQLQKLASDLGMDLYVQRSQFSLCVLFRKPNKDIVMKYSLSTKSVPKDKTNHEFWEYAHFFTMNDVDEHLIDRLIQDLRQPGAFDAKAEVTADEAHDHTW